MTTEQNDKNEEAVNQKEFLNALLNPKRLESETQLEYAHRRRNAKLYCQRIRNGKLVWCSAVVKGFTKISVQGQYITPENEKVKIGRRKRAKL